jgi:hypothetical protein
MAITLLNNTAFPAQYVVKKGEQIIARLPAVQKGYSQVVQTDDTYEVVASTVIDGNTYTSAPIDVSSGMGFLAQVLQVPSQGTYEFDVQEVPTKNSDVLSFSKTCINPVVFTITKDGKPLQSIVVENSFESKTLTIGNTYYIYAVINGVTTATTVTSNPNAKVTAVDDTTALESGYYTLDFA